MCEGSLLGVRRALAEDSVGHKMLQKLGWKKGEGLGKNSKGMTEPVRVYVCTLLAHIIHCTEFTYYYTVCVCITCMHYIPHSFTAI